MTQAPHSWWALEVGCGVVLTRAWRWETVPVQHACQMERLSTPILRQYRDHVRCGPSGNVLSSLPNRPTWFGRVGMEISSTISGRLGSASDFFLEVVISSR